MIGCGWMAPTHAGSALLTPAGLAHGDQFRFVFNTGGTTFGTSGNISDYDSFVQSEAFGATYNGVTVNWLAIGSTSTVNAIDHIGTTNTPVFLADGTLVTQSTLPSGLWSGTLIHAIDEDITGAPVLNLPVWTGTTATGQAATNLELGSSLGASEAGLPHETGTGWVQAFSVAHRSFAPLYGISGVLVASQSVPEPSTMLLMLTGGVMVVAYGWSHHRRAQRRQAAA
jgi:hypothetical protein